MGKYIVKISSEPSSRKGVFKAHGDDGVHGELNCRMPDKYRTESGVEYEVDDLSYSVNSRSQKPFYVVKGNIRKIEEAEPAVQEISTASQNSIEPETVPEHKPETKSVKIGAAGITKDRFKNIVLESVESYDYMAYNLDDQDNFETFTTIEDAIAYATANSLDVVATSDYDIMWVNDEKGLALCAWCDEPYEIDELIPTDVGHICEYCFSAIISRGEDIHEI